MVPRVGDLLEIKTPIGVAYALFTHKHEGRPKFGALIRVFDQMYAERPSDLPSIVKQAVRFSTFFPVGAAVKRGIVEIAARLTMPPNLLPFPIFRSGTIDPKTKKVNVWWLWDGSKSVRVGQLSSEQRELPIRAVWNDTFLVERIVEGWRPESDGR
jgi:hypothetical protein